MFFWLDSIFGFLCSLFLRARLMIPLFFLPRSCCWSWEPFFRSLKQGASKRAPTGTDPASAVQGCIIHCISWGVLRLGIRDTLHGEAPGCHRLGASQAIWAEPGRFHKDICFWSRVLYTLEVRSEGRAGETSRRLCNNVQSRRSIRFGQGNCMASMAAGRGSPPAMLCSLTHRHTLLKIHVFAC